MCRTTTNNTFLLPLEEGQDEGIKNRATALSDSLTPTLSRRERGFIAFPASKD
jgi:hypothetical protein